MKVALSIIGTLLVIAYPIAVYFGLSRFSTRTLGLLLLGLMLPALALRFRGKKREHLKAILPVPLAVVGLLTLSTILEDHRFMLALPVLISLAMLVTFGATLFGETSMIERFARMQHPDLPAHHIPHCRQITVVWCVFFVINGVVAAALAVAAPIEWWTLYTGLIAYGLMGVLFAGEYILRKIRFGHE